MGDPLSNPQIYGFIQTDSMMLWVVILPHPNRYTLCGLSFSFSQIQPKLTHVHPYISNWTGVSIYTEDMLHATAFASLRGNQTTESFRVYLNT